MCPKEALPDHLRFDRNPKAWLGTDNASQLMRLKKRIQTVFAAGPRIKKGFFKWREYPTTLFVIKGKGPFRLENSNGKDILGIDDDRFLGYIYWKPTYHHKSHRTYLSRIQCWTRWAISLQWPLFFNVHWFYNVQDVVNYPEYKSDFGLKKLFTFYIGFKRDSDIYYIPTLYIGGNFE